MTTVDTAKPIIVAVDRSESALRAARWAATQAARRGRRLRVVQTYQWPLPRYGAILADMSDLYDVLRTSAEKSVLDAVAAAEKAAPGLAIESETLRGPTIPVLRTVSRQACLLVLGSRGLGGFTGLLAGSVTVTLAAHGRCPVAVVRGDDPPAAGPVVVGVDGSEASESAIAFAFDEAAVRGCELVAVHTWNDAMFPYAPEAGVTVGLDWAPLIDSANEVLVERLAGWQEKYPDVVVRRVVENDRPAHALLAAAQDAQLLVVGSRGRGGFTGLAMGSVSQVMIHHAPCPVVIARLANAD